ncbi:MAG: threonine dehydratase [Actinomycetota bacterium]|jgi:threonine dehydratase|nr:threonine dehydratase [Actinomycetota bacterium]
MDLTAVLDARNRIAPYLNPTPLYNYPALSELVGTEVWVKHENHLPTAAFKVRGGLNLAAQLTDDERQAGLVAASTGNHGQSIAYAAKTFGTQAIICVPEGANPTKVDGIRRWGATIVEVGRDFDDAREHSEKLAQREGYRYVHSGDEPHLIAGVGTYALEIFEELPDVDVIIVPVGGGSGAAGACVVAAAVNPSTEVIGVQSAQAPAGYRSWKAGSLVEDQMGTFAEGLATRTAFEYPQKIMREHLSDFVLVDDDDIRAAMLQLIQITRNLVEAAGAAGAAAALQMKEQLAGKKVVVIMSGGNIAVPQLRELLAG